MASNTESPRELFEVEEEEEEEEEEEVPFEELVLLGVGAALDRGLVQGRHADLSCDTAWFAGHGSHENLVQTTFEDSGSPKPHAVGTS